MSDRWPTGSSRICTKPAFAARVEGVPHCDWVLIDAGDVIVHVFRPEVRAFYNLEKMWTAGPAGAARELDPLAAGSGVMIAGALELPGFCPVGAHHSTAACRIAAIMRIVIAAVGRLKQGPERELAATYRKRAEAVGRSFGLRDIEIVEIRESRAHDAERRRTEESIAIANIIPERAIVAILDERGENLDSASVRGAVARVARAKTGRRPASSSAAPTGWRQACASAPSSSSPSGRRPGRISWCASCCWNSFTAPARSWPATPITGPDPASTVKLFGR